MSGKKLIGLGDKTTTGGAVIECFPEIQLNNQGTTVVGMKATCPACSQGVGVIAPTENISFIINGRQVARELDDVLCGCPKGANKLIGAPNSFVIAGMPNGTVQWKMPFTSPEAMQAGYEAMNSVLNGANPPDLVQMLMQVSNAVASVEWQPVQGVDLPMEIYHTKNQMDDYKADDLQHGDLGMSEILKLGKLWNFAMNSQEFFYPAKLHFSILRAGAGLVSNMGRNPIIVNLLDHFEANTGTLYKSSDLDAAMRDHRTTKVFTTRIKEILQANLNSGFLPYDIKEIMKSALNKTVSLPKFDDKNDWFNGMGMAVHDIYAMKVTLVSLEYRGNEIRGELVYKIQDHFGLDIPDVNDKVFSMFPPFRSWFLLQRYKDLDYKPFITEMNFEADIK
ncbi:PAAR domain-containing protein [Aeromonas sobria]|uniref:PAAR domain-containing protein n=1 Tax=Aeromonas sobria TaxID=646 RepID=UPI001561BD62|nr:PAAR domain-containing protein [Aeromonas sobria]